MPIRPHHFYCARLGAKCMCGGRERKRARRSVNRGGCVCARVNEICKPHSRKYEKWTAYNTLFLWHEMNPYKRTYANDHLHTLANVAKQTRKKYHGKPTEWEAWRKKIVWRKTQTFLHADCIHFNRRHNPADVSRLPRMRLLRSDDILSNENGAWRKVLRA